MRLVYILLLLYDLLFLYKSYSVAKYGVKGVQREVRQEAELREEEEEVKL